MPPKLNSSTQDEATVEPSPTLTISNTTYPLVDIRATGDILLEVTFSNTSACNKSIPPETIRHLKTAKAALPSTCVFYRVRLETLKKQSRYFAHLLGPVFAEGKAIEEAHGKIVRDGKSPTDVEAEGLPRVKIVDEDGATRTFGREVVFRDMLRIIHGADHLTKPITTNVLAILTVMADRYAVLPTITRYMQKTFSSYKYPITVDKNAEELLRQKILIFFHTQQLIRFGAATRELILRGSILWSGVETTSSSAYTAAWWDLPNGLETELCHRRALLLRTITSIQMQYLQIFSSSRDRQCKLGYDSSSSCDSFQLGEMIKFLTKRNCLHLIPLQAVSPEDEDYIWPEAYMGDVEQLIGVLRQCPSYQIDKNHTHCGLRTRILPCLDYIKSCMDSGLGIRLIPSRNGEGNVIDSWTEDAGDGKEKKSFWVGNENVGQKSRVFDLGRARSGGGDGNSDVKRARALFTAKTWNWVTEANEQVVGWSRPTYGLKDS